LFGSVHARAERFGARRTNVSSKAWPPPCAARVSPAGAVFEAGYGLSTLEDSRRDGVAFIVCPDVDLSVSRLVAVAQARSRDGDSESLEAEFSRLRCVPWGSLKPLSVSWLPERGSPLFGRTPRPLQTAQLTIYATAEAPLPFNKTPRAREWVEQILNGGSQGFQRALRQLDEFDRIAAIAGARAHAGRYLKRPLPVHRRVDLDTFRLRCAQRLAEFRRSATEAQFARAIAEILVASAREPAVAEDLRLGVGALLVHSGREPPLVLVLGARCIWLLRAPDDRPGWVDVAISLMHDGHEDDLATIWSDNPTGIIPPQHVNEALSELWKTGQFGTDQPALSAFAGWAMRDARERRARGVRGPDAYVSVAEPRLRQTGLARAYFLRETETHVIVLVASAEGGRVVVRLPRSGEDWEGWSSSPGGALLAAFLAGAYRDMVVPLDVMAFVEDSIAPTAGAPMVQLEPVGYIPARRRPRRPGDDRSAADRTRPAPHQVTWYVRRLPPGHRANSEALERAASIGMAVPPGYTFVDSYFWPRASDPRSVATALQATLALASWRALLQASGGPEPDVTAVADQQPDE
jgi:hypothetical protein